MSIRYIDYGIYGDGDVYESNDGQVVNAVANREVHGHRVGIRLKYTAALVPGGSEAFKLFDARLRTAVDRQGSFTHEAFIDRVTPSTRISVVVKHTGSEFIVQHIQIIAHRKKHQPIG